MTLPRTCKDFVSHPHLVETKSIFKDKDGNTFEDVRMRGCYRCQEASASEEQGTTAIAEALIALGIPADVHQTGGFTMCVYIKTGDESYIYANAEGFSFYKDEECEGWANCSFAESETTAEQKAKAIQTTMKTANLEAEGNWSCGACGEICNFQDGTVSMNSGLLEFTHKAELCPAQDEI